MVRFSSGCFTHEEEASDIYWTRVWVATKPVHTLQKGDNLLLLPESNSGSSVVQSVLYSQSCLSYYNSFKSMIQAKVLQPTRPSIKACSKNFGGLMGISAYLKVSNRMVVHCL
jgi:hypothetical protein